MHAVVVERPAADGRIARSPVADVRRRLGTAGMAVRLGELVKGAMLTVEKPW